MDERWLNISIFILAELATLAVPLFLVRRIIPPYDERILRRPSSNIYWGMVGVAQGALYCAVGLFLSSDNRIWLWGALVTGSVGAGLSLILWTLKNKITLSDEGMRFDYLVRATQFIRWDEIEYVRQGWLGYFLDFLTIRTKSSRTVWMATQLENIESFEDRLTDRGIEFNRVKSD